MGWFKFFDKPFSNIFSQKWVQIAFLLGICFILYFVNLGRWDLWVPDEPRYAQIAKEMVNGGDWILMHLNGKVYGDKPPLFFWLIALSSFLWQGFTSFSVRFPSALFGTLTVLLTFFIGKRLYSSWVGFFSGLILATSLQFAHLSTRANIDATLTFFTTASLLCFFLWYQNRSPHPFDSAQGRPSPLPDGERSLTLQSFSDGAEEVRGNLSIYGFYISMAFATLAKGPIGFILPLLVSLIYLLVQKDFNEMKRMKWVPGIPLLLAIVLAWYLPAVLSGGKVYLEENLFRHTTEAYRKGWTHANPIYYYLYIFPGGFMPWIFFLPSAIGYGWSRAVIGKKKEFLFLVVWCAVIFTFFSLSKSKRALYLLPLYPAASLMVGKFWCDLISNARDLSRRGLISFPLYGFIGFGLIAGVAIPWVASIKFPSYLSYSLPVALLLAGCCLTMLVFCRFKNYRAILFLLIGMMVAGYFYTLRVIFPSINLTMSARYLSEEITSRIQPGNRLAVYKGIGIDTYNYYTGVVPILLLGNEEALLNFLGSRERVFCLLTYSDFSHMINTGGKSEVQLIARRRVRNDDVVLISNRQFSN